MKSHSFFRYPGGKTKLRKEIIPRIQNLLNPEYTNYVEPFFGGGSIGNGVLDVCPHIESVLLNDLDAGIWALWSSVYLYPDALKERVREFTPSVQKFWEFKEFFQNLSDVESENLVDVGFKKLALHQISYSGLGVKSGSPLGGIKQESKYPVDCRWSPPNIIKKIDVLNKLGENHRLTQENIQRKNVFQLLEELTTPSVIYLDPPYFVKGNELYQFGFTEDDHIRLAKCLKASPHRWILSYDDVPEIRALYEGWSSIDGLSVSCTINVQNGNSKAQRKGEVLISNA